MTSSSSDNDLVKKNARSGLIVLIIVFGMLGLSFAAVPLYSMFCKVTGFGGTTQTAQNLPDVVLERKVTVQFNADTGRNMPWVFKPEMRSISVQLGQRGFTNFTSRNPTQKSVTGTAIYNVTPLKVGKYFHKIQCFCFDEQTLKAGESVEMPVLFYVDPKMNDDPNMNDVKTITLSYTFFKTETKELEDALEGFYNE
jgi:cytochrome c oxidase assembly protein subunit 11